MAVGGLISYGTNYFVTWRQAGGGLEVYDEFKFGRLYDWQVSRFFALENTAGVDTPLWLKAHHACSPV
jgi:hypothetical protein